MTKPARRWPTVLLLAAGCLPNVWAAKPKRIDVAKLPAWVQEAARAEVETGSEELIWLHDERIVEPLADGRVRVTKRTAARPLRTPALGDVGTFTVFYYRGDSVEQLNAWTILADGSGRKAHPKDVEEVSTAAGVTGYHDGLARVIRAPGLTVGGFVAYESVVVKQLDTGAYQRSFGHVGNPTRLSRLILRVPDGWGYEVSTHRLEQATIERTPSSVEITATGLAEISREPLGPPGVSMLPMSWVRWWSADGSRGYRDWNAVGDWFRDLTQSVLDDTGEVSDLVERLRPAEPGELKEALTRSFEFAAQEIRYVAIDIGLGLGAGYKPHTPASVCSKRFGDCKDKAFLLRSIAAGWGLEHYPVLVRTRGRGPVDPAVPTPSQFNHCIAAIGMPAADALGLWSSAEVEPVGRVVFMDATVSSGSAWDLPTSIQGTTALLIHPGGGTLVTLPTQPPRVGAIERGIEAELDSAGRLVQGRIVETWTGTSAARVRRYYSGMTERQQRGRVLRNLQQRFPGVSISDYAIEGLDQVEQPLVETTSLLGGRVGKRVGDLLLVGPGTLGGNPLGVTLAAPPRRWPLHIKAPREETLDVVLGIAGNWKPEAIPAGRTIRTSDVEFTSEWSLDQDRLRYRSTFRLLSTVIPPERYAEFRDAIGEINQGLAESIVLVQP